ncbi:neuronal tyrosine-phosphorylated phosphoinositide-3-kinase adapter 1-like [Hordeum vulgare subsp. vulgare]|uniref:neuronal tyrosine-phosphorylated phosphoinositide-3-kinase adapter 1-like n=1 Tax=Hordeum vulgare subsp. vulgare TaxID=112509 RepID=UPI001D1A533B|nr:neuronal tyrosine-phosphorylated phosphoinositide-3-kinase adapter 1-like [Hordeum vulgare subsp. vulgare]
MTMSRLSCCARRQPPAPLLRPLGPPHPSLCPPFAANGLPRRPVRRTRRFARRSPPTAYPVARPAAPAGSSLPLAANRLSRSSGRSARRTHCSAPPLITNCLPRRPPPAPVDSFLPFAANRLPPLSTNRMPCRSTCRNRPSTPPLPPPLLSANHIPSTQAGRNWLPPVCSSLGNKDDCARRMQWRCHGDHRGRTCHVPLLAVGSHGAGREATRRGSDQRRRLQLQYSRCDPSVSIQSKDTMRI